MATNQYDAPKWTAKRIAKLGKVPDAQIARQMGTSGESVRRKRQAMRIPAYRPEVVWTDDRDALLGTMPDADVAKKLKCSPMAVRIRRHRLEIPAFTPPRPPRS